MDKIIRYILVFIGVLTFTNVAVSQVTVYKGGDYGSKFYRIPAIVTASDGTLVTVADKRIEHNGDLPAKIDVVSRRSFDNGLTWEPYVTVASHDSIGGCGDAALVIDQKSGDIIAIFSHGNGFWGNTPAHISVARSNDNGLTWSAMTDINPQILTTDPNGAQPIKCNSAFATSGRALQLKDGRIMFALVTRNVDSPFFKVYVVYSDDGGYNWKVSRTPGSSDGDESKIVELSDGSLIMSVRNRYRSEKYNNRRLFSRSFDRGETWSEMCPVEDIVDPACNGEIITAEYCGKEVVLHSSPGSTDKREKVTIYASLDGGKTFPYSKVACEGGSAYSSMTMTADGMVGILIEEDASDGEGFDLVFRKIPLAEILNEN